MSAKRHPVVLRFEGMRPEQLARYIMHLKRNGGDLDHVDKARSHLNKRLIGEEDWAEKALAEIDDMRMHNYADELERLKARRRTKELRNRTLEGPKDPWRPSKHGPMREIILTANAEHFDGGRDVSLLCGKWAKQQREQAFEVCAVEWLKATFGDDVIHARCDRDEKAYHIHAIVMPRATDDHGRRVLQPSKFPEIANYELAQDLAGIWFAQVGLDRGQTRAFDARQARANGLPPPERVVHKRTAQWRAEQNIKLARKEALLAEKEGELDNRETDVAQRDAELRRSEARLDEKHEELDTREQRLDAREETVEEREREANAVLEVADAVASGDLSFAIAPDGQGEATPVVKAADLRRQEDLAKRIAAPSFGVGRLLGTLGKAWAAFRSSADAKALERYEKEFEEVGRIRSLVADILARLPAHLQSNIDQPIKMLAASLQRLNRMNAKATGDAQGND